MAGFTGIPRGRTLAGCRAIAAYLWGDAKRWRSIYRLDRNEYGLVEVCGRLTAFTGWIDAALERKAGGRARNEPVRPNSAAEAM